ncbi:MAG TPA: hypothetical protein VG204_09285 [Terriglobia bacterium]|nr:hypothetical protein [Terriglobia bacterium]
MRTVIEAEIVSEVIDREQEIYPRLNDAFEALKWWLAHEPESGEIIDDLHWMYKQKGNKQRNIPALVAIYTFDEDTVSIEFILVRVPIIP